jgi:protein-tyrosine kinase
MTRLFDALSKARSARPSREPVGAPSQFASAAPPAPMKVVRPTVERPPVPGAGVSRLIVPFTGAPALPDDVQRELTGLRISLEAALTQRIPRTVMFIASQGGEGTTTVAAQFAQALASDERLRVLLLDAHVRRSAYRSDGSPEGALPVPATPYRPGRSGAPRPDLMPLPEVMREAHTLTPESLRESLDAVASGYDWIVIDGPPVLDSPDAATLSVVADGVVVVVQAGRTKRPVLTRSVDLVNRAGGRVLGMVLNRRRLEIPGFIYRRI